MCGKGVLNYKMTLRIYECEKCKAVEEYDVRITQSTPVCIKCGGKLKQIWDRPPVTSIVGLPKNRF